MLLNFLHHFPAPAPSLLGVPNSAYLRETRELRHAMNAGSQAQYRDEGYLLEPGLIPNDLIEACRQRVLEVIEERPGWDPRRFQDLDPAVFRSSAGHPVPVGIQRPASEEEVFSHVAHHPGLVEAMRNLLEGNVQLSTDQIGVKHGWLDVEQGGRSYFHQDSWYWKIEPEMGCNCWIPLQDVGQNDIALAVMPGSHSDWQLTEHESYFDDPSMGHVKDGVFEPFKRHRIPHSDIDSERERLIPTEPGDGLFFTNYTWHRSEPNRSGETKAFYAIAYQRTDV